MTDEQSYVDKLALEYVRKMWSKHVASGIAYTSYVNGYKENQRGAIAFAEWLRENNMSPNGFGGWGGGKINVNLHGSKTEDLYKLWLDEGQKAEHAHPEREFQEIQLNALGITEGLGTFEQRINTALSMALKWVRAKEYIDKGISSCKSFELNNYGRGRLTFMYEIQRYFKHIDEGGDYPPKQKAFYCNGCMDMAYCASNRVCLHAKQPWPEEGGNQ